jgi:hypothetical protein
MTQQNLRVKNPSLTLYAFHIRTDMATEVVPDAARLWENLTQLSDHFSIPELQQLTKKLICYQDGKYNPDGEQGQPTYFLKLLQPKGNLVFSPVTQTDDLILSGFIYPLRLHDTYVANFTIFYHNQEVEISNLRRFNPQACLMPTNIQASLGQTLLLYVEPIAGSVADQAFADECVKALLQDSKQSCPPLTNKGKLFGSPIFEYEAIPQLIHVLVWLGEHSETLELATKATPWLINLLNCRSKILFASHQARLSNDAARQLYSQLEGKSQQLKTGQKARLAQLETLLTEIAPDAIEYASHLRNLENQRTTVETNADNYGRWLAEIRSLSRAKHEDNLKFWNNFHDHSCNHYQQQITIYLNYLKPGHQLFGQLISIIRGMVDIEGQKRQAEFDEKQRHRDRRLQSLIAFIGTAVGVGAISATTIPNPTDLLLRLFEIPSVIPEEILKVMFHMIVGGVTALIISPVILYFLHKQKI